MNKKGQVLVLFLLLLPIIIMLTALIIDTGYSYIEKRSLENEVKSAIRYHFKDQNNNIEQKLMEIDNNVKIEIDNNFIEITLEKELKSLGNYLFRTSNKIKVNYVGRYENDKVIIRKD